MKHEFELPTLQDTVAQSLLSIKISTFEIKNIIQEINPKNASGHDKITPKIVKELLNIAVVVLSLLFNAIFNFAYCSNS